MTKIIELVDLVIRRIVVNYESNSVTVLYDLVDNNGKVWQTGEATFWVTMPEGGASNPNWFVLPPTYIPTLLGLKHDADTALTAAFLV
jgi:hypothetical protein